MRCFQWIAELKTLSRDRVSISPRSCVDFVWCAQAEIVCRFRRDRVSISPGDRLGYVGDRLRFGNLHRGGELLERERVIAEEVEEDRRRVSSDRRGSRRQKDEKEAAAKQHNSSRTGCAVDRPGRPPAASGTRSTGAVDRRAQRAQGNRSVDRPVDRLK